MTTQLQGVSLLEKQRAENFPVALRLLPSAYRHDLAAIYDVVRTIDDLGDEAPGDRITQLRAFSQDLAVLFGGGTANSAVLQALAPTVAARQLDREPFDRLIEANLTDQYVSGYQTIADVLDYCALSAAPIGRLVLAVFGQSTPSRQERSDRICAALQLLEHWQDVAEDRRAGRVYLPVVDMVRFGVSPTDLDVSTESAGLRRLMRYETEQAARLLESGTSLVDELRGWAKVAVAGYVAGGRATVQALRRSGGRVLAGGPKPRRRDVIVQVGAQLIGGGLAARTARSR